jgi:hypothetical protein
MITPNIHSVQEHIFNEQDSGIRRRSNRDNNIASAIALHPQDKQDKIDAPNSAAQVNNDDRKEGDQVNAMVEEIENAEIYDAEKSDWLNRDLLNAFMFKSQAIDPMQVIIIHMKFKQVS